MGYTITEKILLAHSGKKVIEPGEFIDAKIDLALGNDITAPLAIQEFEKLGLKSVFDRNKIALIPDHFTPNKDQKSANQVKVLREFADKQKIKHYYEVGLMGVEHALLPEMGIVLPGDCVIGADSHTCTYGALGVFSTGVGSTDLAAVFARGRCWFKVPTSMKFVFYGKRSKWVSGKDLMLHTIGDIGVDGALYRSMEFTGETIRNLDIDSRLSMCNMAIEAGGKSGIIEPDEITRRYVSKRAGRKFKFYKSDKDASYHSVREYDVRKMEPQVSAPDLPSNTKPVSAFKKVKVDQVVIGGLILANRRKATIRVIGQQQVEGWRIELLAL